MSFDPNGGPGLAAQKKAAYVERYGRPQTAAGWHFLTGTRGVDRRAHRRGRVPLRLRRGDQAVTRTAPAIELLTPKGMLARYFYGIEFSPRDMRLGLVEASERADRHADRRRAAALLPLRPDDREVRRDRAPAWCRRAASLTDRWRSSRSCSSACGASGRRPGRQARSAVEPDDVRNFPFFPAAASAQAGQVDAVYFFMLAVTAFFTLLIAALVVVFAVKFRRRHDDEVGAAIHGSLALELLWTSSRSASRW